MDMTENANLHPILTGYIAWVKAHETLVIICLAAYLLFRTGQGVENLWVHHEDKIAEQATTKAVTDAVVNKQLQDNLSEVRAMGEQQFAAINASLTQQQHQLEQQQQKDSQATQQQILDRWKLLLPMKPGSVQSNGTTDTISVDAANQTVQALEQIPVLQTQITDLNQKLVIDDQIIGKQDELITGLNHQITDEKASHLADVNLEKAKAKHQFWKGFKIGAVVGVAIIEAARIWAGHP